MLAGERIPSRRERTPKRLMRLFLKVGGEKLQKARWTRLPKEMRCYK